MSRITIIDSPNVTLWYDSDKQIVHHQIHRFIYGKEFRELLIAGTELIKKHQAKKWLSDDRGNTVVSEEDPPPEWIQANFLVPSIQAGWKYWAIVRPRKVLAQMGMERKAKELAEHGVTVELFSDPVEAMSWLEKQ